MPVLPADRYVKRKMVRITCEEGFAGDCAKLREIIGDTHIQEIKDVPECRDMYAWFTPPETEAATGQMLERLKQVPGFVRVEQVLRVHSNVE